jgi:hypothetical protein
MAFHFKNKGSGIQPSLSPQPLLETALAPLQRMTRRAYTRSKDRLENHGNSVVHVVYELRSSIPPPCIP